MNPIENIIAEINSLFTKQPNTIYEVRLVNQRYAKKVNVFFEYYWIGHATHSQQIARLNDEYRSQIPELATMIHQATGLTVNTN
ncbi:hypothetical protein ACF0HZ_04115 [Leuconostoc suionicum]|uniref:hypothetical protein n=1 Tax=Leuconostoc suionicum TaxID=1511761 RepID=UPI00374A133B